MGYYDSSGNYIPGAAKTGGGGFGESQDVGDIGTTEFRSDVYKPNNESFANPDDQKNKDLLGQYYSYLGGRAAPQATAAQLGTTNLATAAYTGPAATYGGATIDTAESEAARKYQMGLLSQLSDEASGKAPSIAAAQMQQGLQQNLAQQASLAGSMGGSGNPALALRNLQNSAAQQNQQLLGQAGIARLQEQQMAQQQLGNVSGAVRGQDIGLAAQQAQLAQQAGMFNAQNLNQMALANAGFEQQANLQNASQLNQYGLAQAQLNQQAALANQQSTLGLMGLTQQGQTWALGQDLGLSEADRQAAMQYEQLMAQQSDTQQQIQSQAFQNAAGARRQLFGGVMNAMGGLMMSDEDQKTDVEAIGAGKALGGVFGSIGGGFGADPMQKPTGKPGGLIAALSSLGGDDSSDPEGAAASQERQSFADRLDSMRRDSMASPTPAPAPSGGDGGGLLGGILSDEDEKREIHVEMPGAASKLLDPLKGYSYAYKDPTLPGAAPGRHVGVMAQDLEKSPVAADAVIDGPNGKMVDYARLAPPMLAAEADIHDRLTRVEKMLGVGKKGGR